MFEALDDGKDPAWQWEGKMPEGHQPPSDLAHFWLKKLVVFCDRLVAVS